MSEFVSRWLVLETVEIPNQRTDKTDEIDSVGSVSASESDLGRFSPRTGDDTVAAPAFAPLDRAIITSTAHRTSIEQIHERLAHVRQMATKPDLMPLHQQLVQDWTAIEREKERQVESGRRTA